jgi:hypothetical protein
MAAQIVPLGVSRLRRTTPRALVDSDRRITRAAIGSAQERRSQTRLKPVDDAMSTP